MNNIELLQKIKKLGIEYASWETDLYIPCNAITKELLKNYQFKTSVTSFLSKVDKKSYYEIPLVLFSENGRKIDMNLI